MSGYFGRDYFGGRTTAFTLGPPVSVRIKTLLVHLNADVPAAGTATQPADAVVVGRLTNTAFVPKDSVVTFAPHNTAVTTLSFAATDATLVSRSTNATTFSWKVSP